MVADRQAEQCRSRRQGGYVQAERDQARERQPALRREAAYQQVRMLAEPVTPFTPVLVSVRSPQSGSLKLPFWEALRV